jgi:hypothetical protein
MDTIAKAENVAMALGLSSFLNMNKRFQSSMSLEKAQRGFVFSKLLYVAKKSPLKATENEITNAF